MQGSKKGPDTSTAVSTSDSGLSCQPWWSSIESDYQESALSKNLGLEMGVSAQRFQNVTLDFSFHDQDSCSTQSTGKSYFRAASIGENNHNHQKMSFTQSVSGYDATHGIGKHEEGQHKFTSSVGTQNYISPLVPPDCNQSFAQLAVTFPDQYFNGVLSAYGPQAMVMGVTPTRVPLPLDLSTSEPIYVNAKQYHGILRRRQHRAKLEAQRKLVKNRKPYLHESRHLHALKRARGSGGRFLNMKQLEEPKRVPTTDGQNCLGSVSLRLAGKVIESKLHRPDNDREGTSTTSCSDVTSSSTSDDIYHPLEFRFFDYSACMTRDMHGGGGNYV